MTMAMEPDELYTLRAQFWLGHYQMAIDEAKAIARRPMSPDLKAEREEFLSRAYSASGQQDKATNMTDTPGECERLNDWLWDRLLVEKALPVVKR